MPRGLHKKSIEAWQVWAMLDAHGRDIDTMAGLPLYLRIEAVCQECANKKDPDGIRWRVLCIESVAMQKRMEQYRERQKDK